MKKLYFGLALALAAFGADAQYLNTGRAGGNGQAGVTFNLRAYRTVIIDTIWNPVYGAAVGDQGMFEVWTRNGFLTSAPTIAGPTWKKAASGMMTAQQTATGTTTLSPLVTTGKMILWAGQNYGFYIGNVDGACGTIYTNWAAGTSDSAANGDISMKLGTGAGFGGPIPNPTFTPRQFTGAVSYTVYTGTSRMEVGMNEVTSATNWGLNSGAYNVTGNFANIGLDTVRSIVVSYQVGTGTTFSDTLTGLNVLPGATYNFTCSTPWTPTAVGNYSLTVSAINPNGAADIMAANNSLVHNVLVHNVNYRISISAPNGTSFCGSFNANLVSSAVNNNRWYRNGVLLVADTTQTISVSLPGIYYSVVGPDTSNALVITQVNPPTLILPDTLITSSPVVLNPGIAASYFWNTGDTSATLLVTNSGIYSVVASSALGCTSSDTCVVIFKSSQPAQPELPSLFNYQASLLKSNGEPWSFKTLDVRFSISDSSQTIFSEKQVITTDARGHFATKVGSGIPIIGSLTQLPWWDGQTRNLKTEVDTNGTGQWISMGTTQLVAVPVSMYSHRSGDGRRSMVGSFTSNGIILSGKGFTVTSLGNDEYEIEFAQPFTEVPHVFLSTVGNSNAWVTQRGISKVRIQACCAHSEIQFEAKGY